MNTATQQQAPTERKTYSLTETRQMLGIGQSLLDELIRTGALRSIKLGTRRLIPCEALDSLLANGVEPQTLRLVKSTNRKTPTAGTARASRASR